MKPSTLSFIIGLAAVTTLHSARSFAEENVVLKWNETILEAVRDNRPGPTVTARALNISSTCAYDAWAAYDDKALATQTGKSLRQAASERTLTNKSKAISYAYYRAAMDLFPNNKASYDALMLSLGYDPTDKSTATNNPTGVGTVACDAVLKYRHNDGSNQLGNLHPGAYSDYTGYQSANSPEILNDPGRWQPLAIPNDQGIYQSQVFLTPHWGQVKPFALKSNEYKIEAPAEVGSPEYREQVKEVISYSATLNDFQKVVAEYWADGPTSELPPGHWNLFAHYVSARDEHNLDDDVKMFFSLNNALLDASIWAWDIKRKYDYVRPISAVHHVFGDSVINAWGGPGLGTALMLGSEWRPYQAATVVTPPFAECVSGHSTFSAAAAAVLRKFTKSDVFGMAVTIPAGSSRVEPGIVPAHPLTLSWATFTDAADEAGISRLYGGIHFRYGDIQGRRVGANIGEAAFNVSLALIEGKKK